MASNPLIITKQGLQRIVQAQATGTKLRVTEFAVSDEKGNLDPERTTTKPIKYSSKVSYAGQVANDSILFKCKIPPGLQPFFIREIYLFLDDGTLFAIGHPLVKIGNKTIDYLIYTGQAEKILDVVIGFTNSTSTIDISVVPQDEFEQSASVLDLAFTLGDRIQHVRQELEDLKKAKDVLFANDREFRQRIETLEEQVRDLQENQIALAASFYNLAYYVLRNTQDIQRILGGS